MRVFKSADGLAVLLPAAVIDSLGLKEGDDIDIRPDGGGGLEIGKGQGDREGLVRLRKYRGRLPAGFRFDRWEANTRA